MESEEGYSSFTISKFSITHRSQIKGNSHGILGILLSDKITCCMCHICVKIATQLYFLFLLTADLLTIF